MGFCFPPPCRVSFVEDNSQNFPDSSNESDIPVRDRKCTDIKYFKILVVYLTFLVISVSVSGIRGDIRRLAHGYDDYGNICGFQNEHIRGVSKSGQDFRDKRFLEVRLLSYNLTRWIEKKCVKSCIDGYDSSIIPRCVSTIGVTNAEALKSAFEALCLDLTLCWKEITVLCFLSICLSGLVLTILRMFAIVVIWTVLILVSVTSIAATVYAWTAFYLKKKSFDNHIGSESEVERSVIRSWLLASIIITFCTVIFFVMVVSLRNKMKLVATLFEEGGKSIADMPMLLLQPVLTHISVAILCCFVCLGLACLQTSGTAEIDEQEKVTFPINIFFQIMRWILLFGFLWISQFLLACQNIIVAGAVAEWYFTRVKINLLNPVWRSINMVINYHLGSAAFGSLILAIVKAIRAVCRIFEKGSNSDNKGLYLLWKIIQCLLACVESFVKILSKYAYVMIVLYSEPFCASARRAFDCITASATNVAVMDGVGSFILFIIELLVSLAVTFIGFPFFMSIEGLQSVWIPTTLVFIFSYLCCHCFISVYEMAIDTLILCFCADCQLNDGLTRPYYMSRSLMIFLKESRRNSTEMPVQNNANLE